MEPLEPCKSQQDMLVEEHCDSEPGQVWLCHCAVQVDAISLF